ncbi:MAG: hypothetical protein WA160_16250 [Pseudobdellovibrio sp.]
MKSILLVSKIIIISVLASAVLIRLAYKISFESILIQSLESKTKEGKTVINKISWFSLPDKDVWMMNQSHHGMNTTGSDLGRLAIIVDKTMTPNNTMFLQIKPGPRVWSEDLITQHVPFKVSCFMCHSNGPRAIRADFKGMVQNSFIDQIKITILNLKIKFQGVIVENKLHALEDKALDVPFRYRTINENDSLLVKSCTRCHNDSSYFARGYLKRQNFLAIQFMVDNGFMPPAKNLLTAKEKQKVQKFTMGLD